MINTLSQGLYTLLLEAVGLRVSSPGKTIGVCYPDPVCTVEGKMKSRKGGEPTALIGLVVRLVVRDGPSGVASYAYPESLVVEDVLRSCG